MELIRGILKKERSKIDQKYKETVSDLYFYAELEHYLNPEDRKKKTDYLTKKRDTLLDALEEVDFILDLMDRAGIDEIYKQRGLLRTCQNDNKPKIEEKGEVL